MVFTFFSNYVKRYTINTRLPTHLQHNSFFCAMKYQLSYLVMLALLCKPLYSYALTGDDTELSSIETGLGKLQNMLRLFQIFIFKMI